MVNLLVNLANQVLYWMKAVMREDFDLSRLWDGNKTDVFLIYRPLNNPSVGDAVYNDLINRKINTYRYKETNNTGPDELWNAELVIRKLHHAIEKSQIIIIIFTENFAAYPTCLDLLVYIIDHFPKHYFKIIPVFINVNRSDLENHQRGKYARAFTNHAQDRPNRVARWRNVLKQISILPSWEILDRYLNLITVLNLIEEVVSRKINRTVLKSDHYRRLRNGFTTAIAYVSPPHEIPVRNRNCDLAPCRVPLFNADGIFGLDSRLKELLSQMQFEPKGVRFVGICGDPGIGKTTLAQKIYDMIADHFDASCFIPHVRQNSRKHGLTHLQNKLLSELTGVTRQELLNAQQGVMAMFTYVNNRKVLLILDDVGNQDNDVGNQHNNLSANAQLDALANGPSFFGPGSIVIITTENEEVLSRYHYDYKSTYTVLALNQEDARELLFYHTFKRPRVADEAFPENLNPFVEHSLKNPMNLKTMGISLSTRRHWERPNLLQEIEEAGGVVPWVAANMPPEAVEPRQGFEPTFLNFLKFLHTICTYNPGGKYLGLFSSLVWSPCYALNPSIIRLIGGWRDWKIFLYVLLSLCVVYHMVIATSNTLKAIYVRFQVLTLSASMGLALYTYHYDKAVNEKPATLDIVSNIMLACMSLSMSKRMGKRELALFGFSLGNLAVQVYIMDKRFVILVIIGGFILLCKNSPTTRVPGIRYHERRQNRPHND